MKKSNCDNFYFSIFGKRNGFEKYYDEGFLVDGPLEVIKKFNNFIQLDTDIIEYLSIIGSELLSTYRLEFKGEYYIFIGQFRYATDTLGRPGFCGAAIVLKNCTVKDIESLTNYINQLLLIAGYKTIKNIDLEIPEISLKLEEKLRYLFDFSDYKTRLKISFDQNKVRFLEKIFKENLGATYSWVFFSPYASQEDLDFTNERTTFLPINYQDLFEDSNRHLEALRDSKQEELEKLQKQIVEEKAAWLKKIKFAENNLKKINKEIVDRSKDVVRKKESEKSLSQNIEEQKKEIEKNQVQITEGQLLLDEIETDCKQLQIDKIQYLKDLDKFQLEKTNLKEEINLLQKDKRLKEDEIKRVGNLTKELINEQGKLEIKRKKLQDEVNKLTKEKKLLETEIEQQKLD